MSWLVVQSDAMHLPIADRSVDLVFGSPPYCDARTYGINAQRSCTEWVDWMVEVSLEALRVCRGAVIWVCAGVTRQYNYWPAPEGLLWKWYRRGGECHSYRPCIFHRVGIPGSGGKDWFRADTEYVLCLKRPGALPWSDNTACGHIPKWAPGGDMSHRLTDGQRRNQWGGTERNVCARGKNGRRKKPQRPSHTSVMPFGNRPSNAGRRADGTAKKPYLSGKRAHTKRRASGEMEEQGYIPPVKANPGNVVSLNVGGGHMGHALAHENEAPFPESLAERFILSCCPPGGTVLDPFSGSGTTAAAAVKHGRHAIACDLRFSQCDLTRRRVGDTQIVMKFTA